MSEPDFHHHVYVVELDPAVRDFRRFQAANPDADLALPPLYVGMTGTSPEERFAQHRDGRKAGRGFVKRYGVRLRPDLYAHLNPMPFDAAAEMERDLAEDLRQKGHAVWQK
ncbi:MAG TPA: hypothetical protein VM778_07940 [Gemmatimonadota bacterium]|nr:hypothetical protein [Gemmatimonadota bacterium]